MPYSTDHVYHYISYEGRSSRKEEEEEEYNCINIIIN